MTTDRDLARIRVIARLDVKGKNLIKGVQLEGLRVVGSPQEYATRYYEAGIDELLYMDSVASLYGRNSLANLVRHASAHLFVPLTVGGGIRSLDDAATMLRSGADKVAVNTAAIQDPSLITKLVQHFGSQAVVLQVDAKRRIGKNGRDGYKYGRDGYEHGWEAYTDGGREHSGRDVLTWIAEGCDRGAGEVLLTSIDREGTRRGFDLDLVSAVNEVCPRPLIVSGGFAAPTDALRAADRGADAIAIADAFHYGRVEPANVREQLRRTA